jgi:hypothetical protein
VIESLRAEPLTEAFNVAVDDAELDGGDFYLLACPGAADGSARAAWYPPGEQLAVDELLAESMLAEANAANARNRHRIAVLEDFDADDPVETALVTAKLRHELEHARQYMACGHPLRELDAITDSILGWKAGGINGSGAFYNLKPIELDANAAASMLLRRRYDEDVVAGVLESDDAALARSLTGPGDPDTLLTRTVCFIFLFHDIAEDPVHRGALAFDRRLELAARGAGALWLQLKSPPSSHS